MKYDYNSRSLIVIFLLILVNCSTDTTGLDNKKECNPLDYVDTTRTYFHYYFEDKIYLTLATDLFYALFDSSVDRETAEANFVKYDITSLGKFSYRNAYLLKPPHGKRAEEFYTFYGHDVDCGFGNQEIVDYSTPIFWTYPGTTVQF
jgi:hypothetical protein